jgi:uncharacterized membrane protein YGL010W
LPSEIVVRLIVSVATLLHLAVQFFNFILELLLALMNSIFILNSFDLSALVRGCIASDVLQPFGMAIVSLTTGWAGDLLAFAHLQNKK